MAWPFVFKGIMSRKDSTRLAFAVLLGVAFLWTAPRAHAGPISYEGGWMFSTENQPDSINWQLSYSLKPWFSLGADYSYDKMEGTAVEPKSYGLVRGNFLLKRWNELDSQANIYLYGGVGGVKSGDINAPAWLAGLEADWETRKYYTSAKAQLLDSDKFKSQYMFQGRIGLAPYLTKFENLHSWVILQVQYFPDALEEKLKVSPVMRFYIDNVLWELGVSARGTWSFNTMVHF